VTLVHLRESEREHERTRAWTWRPFISFEDTNLVGNVYFARFISWQGRCREAFLAEHAPDVLAKLADDLRLVTLDVSCNFYEELRAFDAVALEMRLAGLNNHRLSLAFEYWLERDALSCLAARGAQTVGCMQMDSRGDLAPASIPQSLTAALRAYA
jgi:enediyne biosynthesis thioesterase